MTDRAKGIYAVTVPLLSALGPTDIITSPLRFCGWSLGDAGFQPVEETLTTDIAAAAAGSLTLTGYLTVSEILVEPAAAWPAGVNQVTITNLQGGTQAFDIPGGTANAVLVSFPVPVPTTGTPVISVPAIVGGPAYSITGAGTVSGGNPQAGVANCQIVDGAQIVGLSAPLNGVTDTQMISDYGIQISRGLAIKVISGAVSGCLYVYDGTDIYEGGKCPVMSTTNLP